MGGLSMALPPHLAKYNALIDFVVNLLLSELTEHSEQNGQPVEPSAAGDQPRSTNREDDTRAPALIATTELLDQ
jgi:hypothetical protein